MAGLTGVTTDVNVTLHDFSHLRASDVDVLLQAPDGIAVILMSDACSASGAFSAEDPITTPIDLTFDDEADTQLPADITCFSGTYRPVDVDDDTNEIPTLAGGIKTA